VTTESTMKNSNERIKFNRQLSSTSGMDSFVIPEEDRERENSELSHRIRVSSLVDDILCEKVDIESCSDCNSQIIEELQKRLKFIEDDTNAFKTAIEAFGQDDEDDIDEGDLAVELETLREEERNLLKKLDTAEKEYSQTQKGIRELKIEVQQLNKEEIHLEREYATLKAELANLEEEQKSYDNEFKSMDSHLRKLKHLDPLAAAFHISKRKEYGVINGLRLGYIPDDPTGVVEWDELSAAWGQTALLTRIIIDKAKKIERLRDMKIGQYDIFPLGSRSFILDTKSGTKLPLYYVQSLRTKIIGQMSGGNFDNAMVAYRNLLYCFCIVIDIVIFIFIKIKSEIMKQIKYHWNLIGVTLPYNIEGGQIQDTNGTSEWFTVKFNYSSGQQWCTAMRFMLLNLKWARDGIQKTENEK